MQERLDRAPETMRIRRQTAEHPFGTIKAWMGATLSDVYLPQHNACFAVAPSGEGSAFTPIPGVDLDEILCVQEERQVGNDNCVSFQRLKLQIPESPMRRHFVKARVKVHVYPDGSHALFHGPRCIGRYDAKGKLTENQRAA
jgi:hypothetical protein